MIESYSQIQPTVQRGSDDIKVKVTEDHLRALLITPSTSWNMSHERWQCSEEFLIEPLLHFPSLLYLAWEHRKTQDALILSVWETKEETYQRGHKWCWSLLFLDSNISPNKYIAEGRQDDFKVYLGTVINNIEANDEKSIPFSFLIPFVILRRKSLFATHMSLTPARFENLPL